MSEKSIIANFEAGDILISARFSFRNYGNEVDEIISRKPPFIAQTILLTLKVIKNENKKNEP